MGEILGTMSGGTPPISIVVRKVGETSGNRCIGSCNSFPVEFTEDEGNNSYYFIATDSEGCIVDSRNIVGGVGNINCAETQPSFNAVIVQPVCEDEGYTQAILQLTDIVDGARYKICYNSLIFDCASCTDTDGVISGSSINIPLSTPVVPTSRSVLIRVYKDSTCDSFKEWFGTIITPTCEGQDSPDFSAEAIQPFCSLELGGTPQNAVLKLRDVVNGTRYKICYNTTSFNCDCNSSDGFITGSSIDIPLTPPSEGVVQNVVVRVFNGSSCNFYKDFLFSMRSPRCSQGELTLMNLDLQYFFYDLGPICNQPNTYDVAYDFYVTPNTPGMSENGTPVRTGNTAQRTLPTGNDVPNTYVAASFKMLCGNPGTAGSSIGNGFHRFTWNMSYLKSKYPAINEFVFDVYANQTKNLYNTPTTNTIRPRINAFTGIAMTKQLYSNDAHDASRLPPDYIGVSCNSQSCPSSPLIGNTTTSIPDFKYKTSVNGMRKIGTIRYSYNTNKATWTESTQ